MTQKFQPKCTLYEFDERLDGLFPNPYVLETITDEAEIKKTLLHVLKEPLDSSPHRRIPDDAFWWFRGCDSYFITGFEHLEGNRFNLKSAMNMQMNISKVVVRRNQAKKDTSFVYLECTPDTPKFMSVEGILDTIRERKTNLYVLEEDYENNTGQFVTPFNCFIAPKESRLNNTSGKAGIALDYLCDGLLWDVDDFPDRAIKVIEMAPQPEYHKHLKQVWFR